ncbi:FAD-binding oxidoreductase [Pseudomonas stutzeri]|uniref:2Fe-2S iron-sulfur cluster-binding protein n=1 Tax=Stutzerimonas stutzeri TaxID=316 RepID=UPI001F44062A|nr:2Fe-2S iron-sulfur cluster-binding protein [Stutzerimonas stutzeri]MCF0014239.1 FAD-binding oxidoreductase [Stutzerimonas stutzeri]MCF0021202.1 FAD-binding oxidoreductase [Stutzerimonas stutzeri]MDH1590309.1 FAD-binding oxidoreductase [Stutzerimonas stutzeri]
MLTEGFVGWKRVAALATLAMLLAHGAAGAQSAADPHAAHPPDKTGGTTAAQPDAAGTSSARDSGSMAGMPMGTTPPAGAPMGDDDHAAHHPDKAGSMAVPQPAPADGMPAQSSSSMNGMPMSATPPADASAGDDDHAAHHPDATASMPASSDESMGGSMAGMMEDMMRGCRGDECGRDRRLNKLLYPQLMALPDLPPERRASVEQLAHHRMHEGIQLLASLSSEASHAVQRNDYDGLQEVSDRMRVAWGEFDSGLSAYRALAEGQAPRGIALAWFRREMNLTDPLTTAPAHGVFGLSGFHYFTMALLLAFALLAAWMYVARTRRTNAVLATLRTGAPAPAASVSPGVPAEGEPQARAPVSTMGGWVGKLRVARVFQETPKVKTFRLAPVEGVGALPFEFEPGQFLTLSVHSGGNQVKRSYSIASSPCCHGWCDLTVKHESGGIVSGYLHEQVKEGDLLDASGPYGRFTFRGVESDSVVFLGGGVGITPLMSSIRYLTDQSWNGRIDLVYACKDLESVIFRDELNQLARRHPNLHVSIVLSDESSAAWTGPRGFITAELLGLIPQIRSRRIHLCGPSVMMDAVRNELGKLGIDLASVHSELFLSPSRTVPPGLEVSAGDTATAVTCSFERSGKKAPLAAGQTVLEAAEEVGVPIEYACRQGYCGLCKIKLLSGEVTMDVDDGLTPLDRSSGVILACQAKASADISVDA